MYKNNKKHFLLRLIISLLLTRVGAAFSSEGGKCFVSNVPIASIKYEGLHQTRAYVVQAALENQAGTPFSCAAWGRERNRLRDLDIFAKIDLDTVIRGDSVALIYRFRELPPYIPLASFSKTDQDGLSVGPSISALNFLGTGKRVDLMARFGGSTEYQAAVSGRQLFGHSAEFSSAWIHVDSHNPFEKFHENSHRLKLEGFWPWLEDRRFGMTGMAEYFFIRSDTSGITLGKNSDVVPRLGTGLRWDSRDRVLHAREGLFAETRFAENGGLLGGPADYWEQLADIRGYLPITARQGLAAYGLYQYRNGILSQNLGLYDAFHAGGANTLRGYRENAFQGQNECLVNGEYHFELIPERTQGLGPWSLNYGFQFVTGLEAASLWNGRQAHTGSFHPAIYGGFHLFLPGIDRIRVEIGSPVDDFDMRVQVGLFEKAVAQRFRTR